jgi:hypothetical protein
LVRAKELIEAMGSGWRLMAPPPTGLSSLVSGSRLFISIKDGYRSAFLQGILPGDGLTDLGAGFCGEMIRFAQAYDVGAYTAVDRYWEYPAKSSIPKVRFVKDDMLSHLLGQPDGSSHIVMNAIDQLMLRCHDPAIEREYAERLVAEMARVVPDGGIAFGLNSPCLRMLGAHGFRSVPLNERFPVPDFGCLMQKVS